jgi:hypothetical protein
MPDNDNQQCQPGGIVAGRTVIGMDGADPAGPIVYATLDAQGRISQVRAVSLTQDGQVAVGLVLPPDFEFSRRTGPTRPAPIVHIGPPGTPAPVDLEDFDLGAYTEVGYTSSDGVSWTEAEPFAAGGLVHGPGRPSGDAITAVLRHGEQYGVTIEQVLAAEEHALHAVEQRLALHARTDTAPAPAGDILDRIDAAVDELCACGCGRQVPPDGASAYFATPECQRNWHSAQATDADAVYRRPDAASVYVGADHATVPLHPDPIDGELEPEPERLAEHRTGPIPQCPDLLGAGYRRDCGRCRERIVPQYVRDTSYDIQSFGGARRLRFDQPEVQMLCPSCRCPLDGPVLYADVYEEEGHLILLLTDGQATIRRALRLTTLFAGRCRTDEVEQTWAVMERELTRFRRQWIGRIVAAEQMGMSVRDPSTLIRVTGV